MIEYGDIRVGEVLEVGEDWDDIPEGTRVEVLEDTSGMYFTYNSKKYFLESQHFGDKYLGIWKIK